MTNAINIFNSIVFGGAAIAVLFGWWEPKPQAVAWVAFWAATALSMDKVK